MQRFERPESQCAASHAPIARCRYREDEQVVQGVPYQKEEGIAMRV